MLERRPMLLALIGLMLCISIWRIAILEPPYIQEETSAPYSSPLLAVISNVTSTKYYPPPVSLDILPNDDLKDLIDLSNFNFTINHRSCSDMQMQPLVLVLIHSAPGNWLKRATIRETWGREDSRSRIIFLLGAVNSAELQRKLEQENRLYEDMVQGNFFDSYQNMTYKHVMALKWFTYYCPEAKYVLKTDDDVFVNSPTLYDFLENSSDRRKLIFCSVVKSAKVKRSYRSKWHVSTKEFPDKYYPTYCPGFSIIYSPDAAFSLYREAQKNSYFWIDDVHITGTIAQKVNMTVTPLNNLILSGYQKNAIYNGSLNATSLFFFFTVPNLLETEIRTLWKAVISNER